MSNLKDLKISKELIDEVLRCDALKIEIKGNIIEYDDDFDDIVMIKNINIYEFAFKCKEWSYKKCCEIISYTEGCEIYQTQIGEKIKEFYADSECLAIIDACEWVLNQEVKND